MFDNEKILLSSIFAISNWVFNEIELEKMALYISNKGLGVHVQYTVLRRFFYLHTVQNMEGYTITHLHNAHEFCTHALVHYTVQRTIHLII